jgi:O-antigen/teichoic acid export membrane protein
VPLPETHGKHVLRGTVVSWAQYVVALGVTLAVTPFVLGRLGPAAYGVWLLFTQALGYSGLLDLGVTPALVRYVSEARAREDRQALQQTLGTALRFHAAAAAACLLLGLLFAAGIERWFDLGEMPVDVARRTVVVAALATAVGFPATALTGALRGFQRFDLAAGLGVASHLVRAAAIFVALELGMGLPGLAGAALLGSLVALVGGGILLKRVSGLGLEFLSAGSHAALKRLLSLGAFSMVGTAGWQLAYGSDTILIGAMLTAVDAAHFGLAVNVLVMVSAFVGAFTGNLMPLASVYEARGQTERLRRTYLLGTRIAATLALPQLIVLFMEGQSLLGLWLGPKVGTPAGEILQLLVLAYLPSFLNAAGMPLAFGLGLERVGAALTASEGVTKLGLSLLLIGPIGTKGVALATLASGVVHQGLLWPWAICRQLGLPLRSFWWQALGPLILPAVSLALGLFAWQHLAPGVPELLRLCVAATSVLLYWLYALKSVRHGGGRAAEAEGS